MSLSQPTVIDTYEQDVVQGAVDRMSWEQVEALASPITREELIKQTGNAPKNTESVLAN